MAFFCNLDNFNKEPFPCQLISCEKEGHVVLYRQQNHPAEIIKEGVPYERERSSEDNQSS